MPLARRLYLNAHIPEVQRLETVKRFFRRERTPIASPRGEHDPERRLASRNGYRDRRWDTRVGTLALSIPGVRDGSYFPSLLEPRRRAECHRVLASDDASSITGQAISADSGMRKI